MKTDPLKQALDYQTPFIFSRESRDASQDYVVRSSYSLRKLLRDIEWPKPSPWVTWTFVLVAAFVLFVMLQLWLVDTFPGLFPPPKD